MSNRLRESPRPVAFLIQRKKIVRSAPRHRENPTWFNGTIAAVQHHWKHERVSTPIFPRPPRAAHAGRRHRGPGGYRRPRRRGRPRRAPDHRRHRDPACNGRARRAGGDERRHAGGDRRARRRRRAGRAAWRDRRVAAGTLDRRAQGDQPARHGQQAHAVPRRRPPDRRQRRRRRPLGLPVRLDRGRGCRSHFASMSAATAAGIGSSTVRRKVSPLASTASFVAGGFV